MLLFFAVSKRHRLFLLKCDFACDLHERINLALNCVCFFLSPIEIYNFCLTTNKVKNWGEFCAAESKMRQLLEMFYIVWIVFVLFALCRHPYFVCFFFACWSNWRITFECVYVFVLRVSLLVLFALYTLYLLFITEVHLIWHSEIVVFKMFFFFTFIFVCMLGRKTRL